MQEVLIFFGAFFLAILAAAFIFCAYIGFRLILWNVW